MRSSLDTPTESASNSTEASTSSTSDMGALRAVSSLDIHVHMNKASVELRNGTSGRVVASLVNGMTASIGRRSSLSTIACDFQAFPQVQMVSGTDSLTLDFSFQASVRIARSKMSVNATVAAIRAVVSKRDDAYLLLCPMDVMCTLEGTIAILPFLAPS